MKNVPDLVIGIDASTTACKVILWDRDGMPVSQGRAAIALNRPRPSWHEQSALEWWQALCAAAHTALAGVDENCLAALCIAHQRETFVPVDEQGEPLRPAIVWMDERARHLLADLEDSLGREVFLRQTGKPFSGNLLPGKLAWLAQYEPQVFKRVYKYLDVHAFLVQRLTGLYFTSTGSADPLGLLNMLAGTWAENVLSAVDVRLDQLPTALPPGTILGQVTPQAAAQTGLPAGLPVIAGIGDGQAGGLGANAVQAGVSYLNLGTAVVSGTVTRQYHTRRSFRTMYAGLPGQYSLETVILGGTYTLEWFTEQFGALFPSAPGKLHEHLNDAAAAVSPGAAGLMLVPYWNTVLNPYWDAGASGMMIGWRGLHTPAHIYRAILEGIAFEQRLATQGVEAALGLPIESYLAFGGGAHSALWLQIIADITGKRVHLAHAPEATALGAGILAAQAAGWYPDLAVAAQAMTRRLPVVYEPQPKQHAFYTQLFEDVYRSLFPAVQPYLSRLTELSERQAENEP
jgi:xylulokinase